MTAALAASAGAEQKLDVFVNNGERIPFETLQRAEALASRMFASADVRIAWHGVARSGWKGRNHVIIIQLELDTPAAYHRGALGCSLPYEGVHVSIFYNRIRQMDQPNLEPVLLGHAMVHEMTHLLQGIESPLRDRRHESALGFGRLSGNEAPSPGVYARRHSDDSERRENHPAVIAAKIP